MDRLYYETREHRFEPEWRSLIISNVGLHSKKVLLSVRNVPILGKSEQSGVHKYVELLDRIRRIWVGLISLDWIV